VTFLLRKPGVFDTNQSIQNYVRKGTARLVKGDALVQSDVQRVWDQAEKDDGPVDFCIFSLGATLTDATISITQGLVVNPPDLITRSLLNVVSTMPGPPRKLIVVSAAGMTREGYKKTPWMSRFLHDHVLSQPYRDKKAYEQMVAYVSGRPWNEPGDYTDILGSDWKQRVPAAGTYKDIIILRPPKLTNGPLTGEYRVEEGNLDLPKSISRQDVAHFIVEQGIKHWDSWRGKPVSLAY
jgi:hypothetical protein